MVGSSKWHKEPEKEGSDITWRQLSFTIFLLGRIEATVKFKFFPTVRERESEIYEQRRQEEDQGGRDKGTNQQDAHFQWPQWTAGTQSSTWQARDLGCLNLYLVCCMWDKCFHGWYKVNGSTVGSLRSESGVTDRKTGTDVGVPKDHLNQTAETWFREREVPALLTS